MSADHCMAVWPTQPGPGEVAAPCRFPAGHDGQHSTSGGTRWGVGANSRETLLDVCEALSGAGYSTAGRSVVEALNDALKGAPQPGRCGQHPKWSPIPAGDAWKHSCDLDAGHAGWHREGSMEWSP